MALGTGAALSSSGCEPIFEPSGSLRVGGEEFRPTRCHVLTCPGGIELYDARGARLALELPAARLEAFRERSGTPTVRYEPGRGAPATEIGTCGSLVLKGEGYHGSGRRAASGRISLQCAGEVPAEGTLSFTGCF